MHDIHLSPIERSIMRFAKTTQVFTLAELTDRFRRKVRVPRKWNYSTDVKPDGRKTFLASLLARNGIRKLIRERAIKKLRPGRYGITARGLGVTSTRPV